MKRRGGIYHYCFYCFLLPFDYVYILYFIISPWNCSDTWFFINHMSFLDRSPFPEMTTPFTLIAKFVVLTHWFSTNDGWKRQILNQSKSIINHQNKIEWWEVCSTTYVFIFPLSSVVHYLERYSVRYNSSNINLS